ncbi:MAG: type II toxin-antitoxin system RelE/ParE family toxin [Halobacteriales archaeon]
MSDDGWDWAFSPRANDQFARLDDESQERKVSKLDEVVTSEWRHPTDYLEPLAESPFRKLRVGDFRLGCHAVREDELLRVESIRKRDEAYTGDDD